MVFQINIKILDSNIFPSTKIQKEIKVAEIWLADISPPRLERPDRWNI